MIGPSPPAAAGVRCWIARSDDPAVATGLGPGPAGVSITDERAPVSASVTWQRLPTVHQHLKHAPGTRRRIPRSPHHWAVRRIQLIDPANTLHPAR